MNVAILEVVRAEVRELLRETPTAEALARDVGVLLAVLPVPEGRQFAAAVADYLTDYLNATETKPAETGEGAEK